MISRLFVLALLAAGLAGTVRTAPGDAAVRRDSPEALVLLGRKLMPAPLAQLMERRETDLLRGFRQPTPAADLAEARLRLREAQDGLIRILAGTPSFDEVVFRFGVLAGQVRELNTWRHYSVEAQARTRLEAFDQLAATKRARFVPVFYDYSPLLFKEPHPDVYWDQAIDRNRDLAERVCRLYREGAGKVSFDDRSPAFGLAALHFSHTITDIANAWLYCWHQSNGDMDGVPFFPFPRKLKPNQGVSP